PFRSNAQAPGCKGHALDGPGVLEFLDGAVGEAHEGAAPSAIGHRALRPGSYAGDPFLAGAAQLNSRTVGLDRKNLAVFPSGHQPLVRGVMCRRQHSVIGLHRLVAMVEPVHGPVGQREMRYIVQEDGSDAMAVEIERCDCRHEGCLSERGEFGKKADQAVSVGDRLTRLEAFPQPFGVKIAAYEYQPAFMPFPFLPRPLVIPLDDHVHTLKDVAIRVILEGNDALEPQDVRPFYLRDLLDPRKELLRIHLATAQRTRLYGYVVDGRGMRMVVMVVFMIMVAVRAANMIVLVVVFLRIKEMRIVLQRSFQVERAAIEHFGEIDGRALGAVDSRGGID